MSPSNHPNPCACVCTKCHNGQAIEELKARCLAAEAAVKHHEHYVKTSVSIVADCEGELSKLRVAARQLVSSLPRCMWIPDEDKEPELPDPCGAFATHQEFIDGSGPDLCAKHYAERCPEWRTDQPECEWAAPLRALAALLPDEESEPK